MGTQGLLSHLTIPPPPLKTRGPMAPIPDPGVPEAEDELELQLDPPAPRPSRPGAVLSTRPGHPGRVRPGDPKPLCPGSATPRAARPLPGPLDTSKHSEDNTFLMGGQARQDVRAPLRRDVAAGPSGEAQGSTGQLTRAWSRGPRGARGWALLGQGDRPGQAAHPTNCKLHYY